MKPYRGVIRGNTVILEETPEGAEGAEAVVLLKVSENEDQAIIQRQSAAKRVSDGEITLQKTGRIAPWRKIRLLETNVLVYAYDVSETRRRAIAKGLVDDVWEAG